MNFTRELKYGMVGDDVRYVKDILFKLKYYDKRITILKNNRYGGDTRAAVKAFQAKHQCEITGKVDQLTWDWLLLASTEEDNSDAPVVPTPTPTPIPTPNTAPYAGLLRLGSSGAAVLRVNSKLKELGLLQANPTSEFNSDTDIAIRAFQRTHALSPDGIIGPLTWEVLFNETVETALSNPSPNGNSIIEKIVSLLDDCLANGDIYVWGARGQDNITDGWIRSRETSVDYANRAIALLNKRKAEGHMNPRAFDCSGLISWLFMAVGLMTSRRDCDGIWALCTQISAPKDGALLFRVSSTNSNDETHIGFYYKGYQYHAKGRDYGVVKEKYKASYWHKIGWFKKMPVS